LEYRRRRLLPPPDGQCRRRDDRIISAANVPHRSCGDRRIAVFDYGHDGAACSQPRDHSGEEPAARHTGGRIEDDEEGAAHASSLKP
jgi:hypothetical protein